MLLFHAQIYVHRMIPSHNKIEAIPMHVIICTGYIPKLVPKAIIIIKIFLYKDVSEILDNI